MNAWMPGQTERTCPFCKGDGQCGKCDGRGTRPGPSRWFRARRVVACVACEGSGTCPLCDGQGRLGWKAG